jgi:hypothetical protein
MPKALDVLYCCLRRHQTEKCNKQAAARIKLRQGDKSNLDTIHSKLKDLTRIVWLIFRNKMNRETGVCLPVAHVRTVANLFQVSVHSPESFLQKRHTLLNATQPLWTERIVKFRSRRTLFILLSAPDGRSSKPFSLSVFLFSLRTSLLLI